MSCTSSDFTAGEAFPGALLIFSDEKKSGVEKKDEKEKRHWNRRRDRDDVGASRTKCYE